MTLSKID